LHYAFVEDYIIWDSENELELRFEGLDENSFMGLYFEFPDIENGMNAIHDIVEEHPISTRVYSDPTLVIETFDITPDVIPDTDAEFVVKVKTNVPAEDIEAVYFLHHTKPQVPSLRYDSQKNCWFGVFKTGRRSLNIFCNSEIYAWIKSKHGGIGPKKYERIATTYLGAKGE
jgi:hypothetical protein